MILFKNILFLKEFLASSSCSGLFTKTKKGPGTSFWCTFSAWFVHKSITIDKVSISFLCFFSRYQRKCVTKFLFKQLMTSKTLKFVFSHPIKQWVTRKKGKDGNAIIWISPEWQELFRWYKKHFLWLFKCYHLVKTRKIADNTSFKYPPLFFIDKTITWTSLQNNSGMFIERKLNFSKRLKTIFQKTIRTIGVP